MFMVYMKINIVELRSYECDVVKEFNIKFIILSMYYYILKFIDFLYISNLYFYLYNI